MPALIPTASIRRLLRLMLAGVLLLLAAGCQIVKNYPTRQPFVYKTTFNLKTKLPQTERSDLLAKMENQLDDSLKVKWLTKLFVKNILNKPPVFDTLYAIRSVGYLQDLLKASGYLYGTVTWDTSISVKKDQQRVLVNFNVATGKVLRFDSIGYAFRDSALQHIAVENASRSALKKGETFTKDKIAQEIDRLVGIYRNNGFLKITREDIYAEVDTIVAALIDPGLDPFEQVRLLQEVQKRRENPQIDVSFKQRGTQNPEHLDQFTVRNVQLYPDRSLVQDTNLENLDTIKRRQVTILTSQHQFKPSFLARNTFINPGMLYRQDDVFRTSNIFNQMGAWQQVGVDVLPIDSIRQVDIRVNMFPNRRQGLNVDLEASSNASDVGSSGNLLGLGVNFGHRHRNLFHQAVQSSTNLRFGVELGNKATIIQTYQTLLSQNFSIPKFVTPFRIKAEKNLLSARTIINANASYTIRRNFLTISNIASSIGYEWSNRKNRTWLYSPLNVEYSRLFETDSFRNVAKRIPNYRNFFTDGLIISQYLRFNNGFTFGKNLLNLRIQLEESGGIFGNIKQLDVTNQLYRFVKGDIDIRYYSNHPRHSWAFRLFAGIGYPYGKKLDSLGNIITEPTLPFFRSFYAGGPISMRAWQIRQLGPGSSPIYDSSNVDRFGDVQIESNVEYRFALGTLFGIKVKSALFADIGNIWYRNNQGDPKLDKAVFRLNNLYRDIAVAGGTSLRLDFNYFLIRFDWAYKLKDPRYSDVNAGWLHDIRLFKGQFQLGINYPF